MRPKFLRSGAPSPDPQHYSPGISVEPLDSAASLTSQGRYQANNSLLFACPFYKLNPVKYGTQTAISGWEKYKYRPCAGPGFQSIAHLKEHLRRKHSPIQCERCFVIFDGSDRASCVSQLRAHLQSDVPCERDDLSQRDGVSDAQWGALEGQKLEENQEVQRREKWFEIWDVLFPGITRPLTPWYNFWASRYQDHFQPSLDHGGLEVGSEILLTDGGNFTDSGYGSAGVVALKLPYEIQPGVLEDINEVLENDSDMPDAEEDFDAQTLYSDTSSLRDPMISNYISGFAEELCSTLPSRFGEGDLARTYQVLPELLKAFAVKFGRSSPTPMHQQVMYFVYKYRNQIIEHIQHEYMHSEGQDVEGPPGTDDGISAGEKVSSWLPDLDNTHTLMGVTEDNPNACGIDIDVDVDSAHNLNTYDTDIDDHVDMDIDEPDLPELIAYREILTKDPAYEWLVSRIRAERVLEVPEPNVANGIRDRILAKIGQPTRISRKASQDVHKIEFEVDWDPSAFFHEQQYHRTSSEILAHAITLTGNGNNVQAAVCLQYMTQSWPSTGPALLQLLRRSIEDENMQSCTLPDKTHLLAYYSNHRVHVTASGNAYSVAEVGEQLAWLGAALRSSPLDQGITYCEPLISRFTDDGLCELGFQLEAMSANDQPGLRSGNCWQNLFRNPVVVRGYLIPRRLVPSSGLEVPLNIMAALANARRTVDFCGRTFIKGFSTMLAVTQIVGNTVLWHMFYNQDGSYISYEDPQVNRVLQGSPQTVKVESLETSRHILGWCEKVKSYAGTFELLLLSVRVVLNFTDEDLPGTRHANYKLGWSRLPDPNQKCAFDKVSISGGKYITAGVNCAIGIKDKPVHISLVDDYISMLYMIAERHFVFYDVKDRRAWLVDGANGLLHMLHASIRHHQSDRRLRERFLFDYDEFQEADPMLAGPDAAFEVLASENNQSLPFYLKARETWVEKTTKLGGQSEEVMKEKVTHFCLKDRVDQICHLLGQIIAHQDDIHTQAGVGFRLRRTPRRQLEGFDFMDVATGQGTLWPKVATLHATGAGWVDFARAIHAITFFGTGFGELFRPRGSQGECGSCYWNSGVPKGRDYLAVRVTVLEGILDRKGDTTDHPWRLVDNIYWHTPDKSFEPCKCSPTSSVKHDLVQVLLPATFLKIWGRGLRSPAKLASSGLVVFGHSWKFPLRWQARGDPEEGEPESSVEKDDAYLHDSGVGMTNYSSSTDRFADSASPFSQPGQGGGIRPAIAHHTIDPQMYTLENQQFVHRDVPERSLSGLNKAALGATGYNGSKNEIVQHEGSRAVKRRPAVLKSPDRLHSNEASAHEGPRQQVDPVLKRRKHEVESWAFSSEDAVMVNKGKQKVPLN
ncbi:MAG: hypothetical protein M1813_000619 [Trichoglossum hirsutum]|nr:MAG: hypothetical protein M1813_000619 [Trichoglossum hirsutum]